jgi:ribosomal protein L14
LEECIWADRRLYFLAIGDRIVVVVKKTRHFGADATTIANRVKRGDVRQAVVVRARQNIRRPDGSVIKFEDNACVLVNKSGDPIGTRLTGQFLQCLSTQLQTQDGRPLTVKYRPCRIGTTEEELVEDSVISFNAGVI